MSLPTGALFMVISTFKKNSNYQYYWYFGVNRNVYNVQAIYILYKIILLNIEVAMGMVQYICVFKSKF